MLGRGALVLGVFLGPLAVEISGIFGFEGFERQALLLGWLLHLFVNMRGRKPLYFAIFVAEREVDMLDAGEMHGGHAHGAGVATCVHDGTAEVGVFGHASCIAQREEFGVCCGVSADVNLIDTAGDDLPVSCQDGAKWTSAELKVLTGKRNGLAHG